MHILIAEKDATGRRMLNRILKMEGYEVSVAESGSQAVSFLEELRPDIVLVNVFHCMYSSGTEPAGKISVRHDGGGSRPVLLVTCSAGGESLGEFMSENNRPSDAAFDLLPAKVKSIIMDRIQQMCGALRLCSRASPPEGGFNWQRFTSLMDWAPVLEG